MEALSLSSLHFTIPSSKSLLKTQIRHSPISNLPLTQQHLSSSPSFHAKNPKFKLQTATSPAVSTELTDPFLQEQEETQKTDEKFDWFAQWYPVMPICDLDKRAPHGKKILGLDVVVWWDRNESEWKVFDDACPHRLAPLSEGRIDQWGRLQCVYHGWCFGGAGDCKFIPQAPRDGPPIHTSKKACVAVYPSTVQNDILWFWPNTDPKYEDIFLKKKPPYIPELDDPSYARLMGNRDIKYGYEILTENLMDPAHVPYAHYGIMGGQARKNSEKVDREGGRPLEISIKTLDITGFTAKQDNGGFNFIAPSLFHGYFTARGNQVKEPASAAGTTEELSSHEPTKRFLLIFMCVPVSPGNSRLIWSFPRNVGVWIDKVVPRWMFHVGQNLIIDSDLYLLHVEERKIMDIGPSKWQKACYVPTKSDALVVSFRRWLKKYAGGQIDWETKYRGSLPPSPPKEELMDRYWTHVVNCRSCSVAYKGLNAVEVALQIIAIAAVGIVAATKQGMISTIMRNSLVALAVLSFTSSKFLAHFIYKNFHFHDYNHAFR